MGQIIALQQDFKTSAYQSIFTELWWHDEEEFRIQNSEYIHSKDKNRNPSIHYTEFYSSFIPHTRYTTKLYIHRAYFVHLSIYFE